jgi:DNA-binding IclR family transcriptional regulator
VARPAPAVDRAVDVLDFLADNPRDAFSLSELARRLGLNKASAHATLNALVDRGYLLRHPVRKDYRLGPRLIAVGQAAREQYPVVEFARDELRRLSEDIDTECVASAPIGDEMVIVDQAGPVRPIGLTVAVGHRFPLVPPMGTIFMAWSSPEAIDEWLRRVGADATEAELDRYRQALANVRERG